MALPTNPPKLPPGVAPKLELGVRAPAPKPENGAEATGVAMPMDSSAMDVEPCGAEAPAPKPEKGDCVPCPKLAPPNGDGDDEGPPALPKPGDAPGTGDDPKPGAPKPGVAAAAGGLPAADPKVAGD